MTEIPLIEVVIRLVCATGFGAVIGIDRDVRDKPIGSRTLALVGLGSAVASIAALQAGDSDGYSRVAQGILAGIGFIGAGVILKRPETGVVEGLTTAAAIWVTSAVGMMCALGHWDTAGIATLIALFILMINYPFQKHFSPQTKSKIEQSKTSNE